MIVHLSQLRHIFSNKELDEIYISVAIRSFAMSLVSVFVPIYLYTLGFSFARILTFFIIYHATHGCITIPAARFAARWGYKHAIFLSLPILIVFYVVLYSAEIVPWMWIPAAIVGGLMSGIFWMGYHLDFTTVGESRSYGKQIGTARIVSSLFHTIGPVIGGFVLTYFGFEVLFVVASVLILAAGIPLFYSKDIHKEITFSVKDIFTRRRLGDVMGFTAHGIANGVELVIWPIFIFVTFFDENYSTLGFLVSASFVASLIITYIAGKQTDKNPHMALSIGSIGTAVIWLIRNFIWLPIHVFVTDFIYGALKAFLFIAFDAKSYENAYKSDVISYTIFREISINAARIVGFAVLIVFSDYLFSFATAAAASLLYLFF